MEREQIAEELLKVARDLTADPKDWGFVGDMGRVLGLMKELDQALR